MKEIYEAAKQYIIENYGNLTSAGDIYLDKAKDTWNVKILAKTQKEIFVLGELKLDAKGNVIDAPARETLSKITRAKLEEDRIIVNLPAKDLPKIEKIIKDVKVVT